MVCNKRNSSSTVTANVSRREEEEAVYTRKAEGKEVAVLINTIKQRVDVARRIRGIKPEVKLHPASEGVYNVC